MHPSAVINCERFISKYLDANKSLEIVDIGSFNINGTLRPLFTHNGIYCTYCGYCQKKPDNVDVWHCSQFNCFSKEPMKEHYCCNGVEPTAIGIGREQIGIDWNYYGLDLVSSCSPHGPVLIASRKRFNVDILVDDERDWDIEDESFDVVLSTSCLEHDDMFWVTVKEMSRILKSGGYFYLNVPSSGPYHGYPGDCWRFQLDAFRALEKWLSPNVVLLESYIDEKSSWLDNVGIFQKR